MTDVTSIISKIESALARRKVALTGKIVTRLFDGFGDGYKWLVLDRYDTLAVAHFFPETDGDWSDKEYKVLCEALLKSQQILGDIAKVTTLIIKHHPHDPKKHKMMPPVTLFGEAPKSNFALIEHHLAYDIRPSDSLFCGLYPDTGFLREKIFSIKASKVINAFCFTGALGIAAAREGMAQEILQVDSSPAALSWTSANWDLNKEKFPQVNMRFLNDDCTNFFEREVRRLDRGAPRSDLIIIDPPSFGRGRKGVFSIKNDASHLISLALQCMNNGGTLIFTANYKIWSPERMRELVLEEAKKLGKRVATTELLRPDTLLFPSREPESISVRGVSITLE